MVLLNSLLVPLNKTPLNFFLWGTLKDVVYHGKPATLAALGEEIKRSCRTIPVDTVANVVNAVVPQNQRCLGAWSVHHQHPMCVQKSDMAYSYPFIYKSRDKAFMQIFSCFQCVYILAHLYSCVIIGNVCKTRPITVSVCNAIYCASLNGIPHHLVI